MEKTLVEQYVEDPNHMRLFQQERAIYEVTELLESTMKEAGVTRAELARRLGKTKGWVTQLLDGEANKTMRTVADAFAVLGREYHSSQCPIRIGGQCAPVWPANMAPTVNTSSSSQAVVDAPMILPIRSAYEAAQVSVSSPPEFLGVVVAIG